MGYNGDWDLVGAQNRVDKALEGVEVFIDEFMFISGSIRARRESSIFSQSAILSVY